MSAFVNLKGDSTSTVTDTAGNLQLAEVDGNLNMNTTATSGVIVLGEVAIADGHKIGVSDGTYSSTFQATSSGTTSYTLDLPHSLPASSSAVVNDGSNGITYYTQGFTSNANLALFFTAFTGTIDSTANDARRFEMLSPTVHSDPLGNITQTSSYYISLEPGVYEVTCAFSYNIGSGRLVVGVQNETGTGILGHMIIIPTVSATGAYNTGGSFVTAFSISSTTSISIRDLSATVGLSKTTARPNISSLFIRQIM